MKALLLYSSASGRRSFAKRREAIRSALASVFSVLDFLCPATPEAAAEEIRAQAQSYDVLIVAGGDGTFNNAVNALMGLGKAPVLAYLNFGTLGDVGRNFGIGSRLSSGLKVIRQGKIVPFDVGELSGRYFAYCAAVGRYSDIAYSAKRSQKKRVGKNAYYALALREAFRPETIHYAIEADGRHYEGKTAFVLLMNGRYIGGFSVNRQSAIDDGKMELLIAGPGCFNGLGKYFVSHKILRVSASAFHIHTDAPEAWCLDGEKGATGDVFVRIHPHALRIYSL